ncbi:hypothetical protein ACQ2H7_003871 [Candidozyma auris]
MADQPSSRQVEVVAGLVAGFATTLTTHPLDLIKIRLQLAEGSSSKPFELVSRVYHDIQKSAKAGYEAHGRRYPKVLYSLQQYYRGVGPNLIGNVSAWATYFGLYAEFKKMVATENSQNYFAASSLAGVSTSLITNPIWVLKTRILSTPKSKTSYSSTWDGIRKIYKNEGILTFWKGTIPSLFSVFQGSLQFTFYDHAKEYCHKRQGKELSSYQYAALSVMARTLSMIVVYPTQVIKSRLQSYNFEHESRTMLSVGRHVLKNGGLRGFYRGLSANLIRVLPSTAVMFLSYETTKKYMHREINTTRRDINENSMSEADEPQTKKAKISDEGMSIEKWIPKSISEIKDKFAFDSTTYHSPIPDAVANNPREPVSLGVDEAGRGPVLGPMVYGISYCLESYQEGLKKKYGFADSKTLKDSRRQELFQLIDQEDHELHRNVGWATCTMTAKDISSGMLRSALGQGAYNLNEQAHDTTIALISEVIKSGVNVRKIFVDTVGPPAAYQAKLQRVFSGVDVTVTKKADSIYPIVSTASVVAKVTRDLNLQFYEKNLEVVKGQSLGSGYPSDPTTSKWLKENVDPVFGWHHGLVRFSWQTAKDALEKAGAAKVIYEEECVKDKGYKDVTEMFNEPDCLIDQSYYAKPVVL